MWLAADPAREFKDLLEAFVLRDTSGLRNTVTGSLLMDLDRRPDRGTLAKGFAFGEILKTLPWDWTIHYWRSKGGAVVDFVLVREGRCVAVEVKAGMRAGRGAFQYPRAASSRPTPRTSSSS